MKVQRQVFLEVRESVPIRISEGEIGKKRRERVGQALQNLAEKTGKKSILGFLPARNRSFDFYVASIRGDRYKFSRLSVTSRYWLESLKKMHPDNTVIAVDLIESTESIEKKIIREIMFTRHIKH